MAYILTCSDSTIMLRRQRRTCPPLRKSSGFSCKPRQPFGISKPLIGVYFFNRSPRGISAKPSGTFCALLFSLWLVLLVKCAGAFSLRKALRQNVALDRITSPPLFAHVRDRRYSHSRRVSRHPTPLSARPCRIPRKYPSALPLHLD